MAILGTVFFAALDAEGFAHALTRTLWVQVGLLAAVLALSPLLPRRARAEDAGGG